MAMLLTTALRVPYATMVDGALPPPPKVTLGVVRER